MRRARWLAIGAALAVLGEAAPALGRGGAHTDPVAPVLLWLAVVLTAAKLGADLAARIGQPAVLGELVLGVVLGNLPLCGVRVLEPIASDASVDMLARLGVVVL